MFRICWKTKEDEEDLVPYVKVYRYKKLDENPTEMTRWIEDLHRSCLEMPPYNPHESRIKRRIESKKSI